MKISKKHTNIYGLTFCRVKKEGFGIEKGDRFIFNSLILAKKYLQKHGFYHSEEGYYFLVVIERYAMNSMFFPFDNEQWFKYDKSSSTNNWVKINKPEQLKKFCAFF
jgi:hypothetical protein